MQYLNDNQIKIVNQTMGINYKSSHLFPKRTRFRAYQLGNAGSSFSYFDGTNFTLIEARITDLSRPRIVEELSECGVTTIDVLHITSWDSDHCAESDLKEILDTWSPRRVEYPGYLPHTDTGASCLKTLQLYKTSRLKKQIIRVDPPYIKSLEVVNEWGYKNVLYWPCTIAESNSNDNSTVKLFRSGCFNVLSLGDLMSDGIARSFMKRSILRSETDVLILAHHGADNGFTTEKFLNSVKPSIAICSSDYDNKYDHPKQEIRDLLWSLKIKLYTSKTGDIIIQSIDPHLTEFQVINLISDSEKPAIGKDKEIVYKSKKSHFLENPHRASSHYAHHHNPFKKFR